jgi:carboxyl-terminal processing protease
MLPEDPSPAAGEAPPDPAPAASDLTATHAAPHPPDVAKAATRTPAPRRRIPVLSLAIAVVAVLTGGALFMSGYTLGLRAGEEPGTPVGAEGAFEPFWDTYHTITDRYAGGTVDRTVIVQGAIRGMIEALDDPYSAYLTAEEYRQSLQSLSGQFEGIGAEIASEAGDGTQGCTPLGPDCHLVVVAPLTGSPAETAGLQAGDLVLATDGDALDGLSVDDARGRIRGPKGTIVTLTVKRGIAAPFDLPITRDLVQEREVDSLDLADGTVGYIKLSGFSDSSASELKTALQGHIDAGRKAVILDLRGDPGGYVTAARSIASQFIGSGPIFYEVDANGKRVATDAVPGGVATGADIQVAVLVDGGSASASEIVAGALQDTKRATLVGQQTYGKGTVQEWQELSGEGGAFKLTVARWLTPDGRWIHGTGLTPDVVVTVPATVPPGDDPTLDKALEVLGHTGALQRMPDAA